MARRSSVAASSDVLVAQDNAYISVGERVVLVARGRTTARAGHPIVKAAPNLWAPLVVDFDTEPEPEQKMAAEPPKGGYPSPDMPVTKLPRVPSGPAPGASASKSE